MWVCGSVSAVVVRGGGGASLVELPCRKLDVCCAHLHVGYRVLLCASSLPGPARFSGPVPSSGPMDRGARRPQTFLSRLGRERLYFFIFFKVVAN